MTTEEAKSLSATTLRQILRLTETLSRELPMEGESSIAIVHCEECGGRWPEYRAANHRSNCFVARMSAVVREELKFRGEPVS